MGRPVCLLLALAVLAPGCIKKKVKKVLEKETRASLTVTGEGEVLLRIAPELQRLHEVEAAIETIEKGVTVLRIVGAYAAVVDAIVWLIRQNLQMFANDEATKALLAAAMGALK